MENNGNMDRRIRDAEWRGRVDEKLRSIENQVQTIARGLAELNDTVTNLRTDAAVSGAKSALIVSIVCMPAIAAFISYVMALIFKR